MNSNLFSPCDVMAVGCIKVHRKTHSSYSITPHSLLLGGHGAQVQSQSQSQGQFG